MYPDDAIQAFVRPWWEKDGSRSLCRGRLMDAFVPHADQDPTVFIVEGRTVATAHEQFDFRIEPLDLKVRYRPPKIPVAALPQYPGEVRVLYRAKVRKVLVVGTRGWEDPLEAGLRRSTESRHP